MYKKREIDCERREIYHPKPAVTRFVTKNFHRDERTRRAAQDSESNKKRFVEPPAAAPCAVFVDAVADKGGDAHHGGEYHIKLRKNHRPCVFVSIISYKRAIVH